MNKNQIKLIQLASTDTAAFDGTYKVLSAGLPHACNYLHIVNGSKVPVIISLDGGTTDHEACIPEGECLIGSQDTFSQDAMPLIPKGTKVSVKGAVSVGFVYLAGAYQPTI
jgi:hypothetical protein